MNDICISRTKTKYTCMYGITPFYCKHGVYVAHVLLHILCSIYSTPYLHKLVFIEHLVHAVYAAYVASIICMVFDIPSTYSLRSSYILKTNMFSSCSRTTASYRVCIEQECMYVLCLVPMPFAMAMSVRVWHPFSCFFRMQYTWNTSHVYNYVCLHTYAHNKH